MVFASQDFDVVTTDPLKRTKDDHKYRFIFLFFRNAGTNPTAAIVWPQAFGVGRQRR
jgi:hypothetical protein